MQESQSMAIHVACSGIQRGWEVVWRCRPNLAWLFSDMFLRNSRLSCPLWIAQISRPISARRFT